MENDDIARDLPQEVKNLRSNDYQIVATTAEKIFICDECGDIMWGIVLLQSNYVGKPGIAGEACSRKSYARMEKETWFDILPDNEPDFIAERDGFLHGQYVRK